METSTRGNCAITKDKAREPMFISTWDGIRGNSKMMLKMAMEYKFSTIKMPTEGCSSTD